MHSSIKLSLVLLLVAIFIFSPLVAFAQEEGEAVQEQITSESVEGTTEPSPEGTEITVENPSDPTSSPLSEEYKHKCSPHKPH